MASSAYVLRKNRVIKKTIETPLFKPAIDDVFDNASSTVPVKESWIQDLF